MHHGGLALVFMEFESTLELGSKCGRSRMTHLEMLGVGIETGSLKCLMEVTAFESNLNCL